MIIQRETLYLGHPCCRWLILIFNEIFLFPVSLSSFQNFLNLRFGNLLQLLFVISSLVQRSILFFYTVKGQSLGLVCLYYLHYIMAKGTLIGLFKGRLVQC